jgi:Hint module
VYEMLRGEITLKELRVGDVVAAAPGAVYSSIYSFAHYEPTVIHSFLQIFTNHSRSASPLEVTDDHLVVVNDRVTRARHIRVGDTLTTEDGSAAVVQSIDTVRRRGLYAPLTEHGTIVVSGVTASVYVGLLDAVDDQRQHDLAHGLFAPIRLICRLYPVYCARETHDTAGFSRLYARWIHVLIFLNGNTAPWVSRVATAMAAPLLYTLLWMDDSMQFLMSTVALIIGLATVLLVGGRTSSSIHTR